MKLIDIIQNDIRAAYPDIHSVRLNTLFTFVKSGMTDQRVSVTYLGRGLKHHSSTSKKHDIKRADRLVGNPHLQSERPFFYEYMAGELVRNQTHPLVLIDWSPINGQKIFQLLRASIPMKGRSLTLYEKVFEEADLNTTRAHNQFLDELKGILPPHCQPIIITDAIYRAPWFKQVASLGWFWLGRVRGQVSLSQDTETWHTSYDYFATAKVGVAEDMGAMLYGKTARLACHGVIYKRSAKGRKAKKMRGGISKRTMDKTHEKEAKEPWLLVFQLPACVKRQSLAKRVVKLYEQRMQIEENFRDTKNGRLGMSVSYANSTRIERFDILLLIAALILFVLWCIGYTAILKDIPRLLQANTVKTKRVLSVITVAREVIDDRRYAIPIEECIYVLHHLSSFTVTTEQINKC